jgi:hypothetical protein
MLAFVIDQNYRREFGLAALLGSSRGDGGSRGGKQHCTEGRKTRG